MFEIEVQRWEGRSGSQKWKGRVGAWRRVPSLLCISFLSYGFFFLMLEKKKMPRESIWNRRVEARAKSERAEWEFEGMLPPFSWFFFLFFSHVFCLLCVWEKEDNDNVPLISSVVVLQRRRRRWQLVVITFFSNGVQAKKAMTTYWCCFLFCVRKKEDNGNALSFSFVVLLEQRR